MTKAKKRISKLWRLDGWGVHPLFGPLWVWTAPNGTTAWQQFLTCQQ